MIAFFRGGNSSRAKFLFKWHNWARRPLPVLRNWVARPFQSTTRHLPWNRWLALVQSASPLQCITANASTTQIHRTGDTSSRIFGSAVSIWTALLLPDTCAASRRPCRHLQCHFVISSPPNWTSWRSSRQSQKHPNKLPLSTNQNSPRVHSAIKAQPRKHTLPWVNLKRKLSLYPFLRDYW